MAIQRTVLTFVFSSSNQLLMIWKKRGQGKGKWNVPGGKLDAGENEEAAAIRETIEETGVIPLQLEKWVSLSSISKPAARGRILALYLWQKNILEKSTQGRKNANRNGSIKINFLGTICGKATALGSHWSLRKKIPPRLLFR